MKKNGLIEKILLKIQNENVVISRSILVLPVSPGGKTSFLKMADGTFKQEMPPKGGYAAFNIARNVKQRGPSGFTTFVIGTAVMLGGFMVIKYGNNKRRYK